MSEHKHLIIEHQPSRAFAQHVSRYLLHVADEVRHTSPRTEPAYDAVFPGLGSMGAAIYPSFEGLDPVTGSSVKIPRVVVPAYQWNQEPAATAGWQNSYFAQWMTKQDPAAAQNMVAVLDQISTTLHEHPAVSLHVYGLGVFMVDDIGGLFSVRQSCCIP